MRITENQKEQIKKLALSYFKHDEALIYLHIVNKNVVTINEAKNVIESLQQLNKFKRINK